MGKTWDYMMADPQLRWCVGSNIPHRSIPEIDTQDRSRKGRDPYRVGSGEQRGMGHVRALATKAPVEARCRLHARRSTYFVIGGILTQ